MLFLSNYFVALLAVGATYLYLRATSRYTKITFGLLWLLLLPNAAYLFTDYGNFAYKWSVSGSHYAHWSLLLQYSLLGLIAVAAFIFSFLPFEKIVKNMKLFQNKQVGWLIAFNFLIAYGVVLGRYEHINSYVIFSNPNRVSVSAMHIFASVEFLKLILLYGLLFNLIYFIFRSLFLRRIDQSLLIRKILP